MWNDEDGEYAVLGLVTYDFDEHGHRTGPGNSRTEKSHDRRRGFIPQTWLASHPPLDVEGDESVKHEDDMASFRFGTLKAPDHERKNRKVKALHK